MKKPIAVVLSVLLVMLSVVPALVWAEAEPTAEMTETIPGKRLLPRLVDDADLLTEEEEMEVLTKLDEISENQKLDVIVVTTASTEGKTPMDFADDFYDDNGYGMGENGDGVLLLVSMEARDWWISTCGYGVTAFTDAGIEYLSEQFLPALGDGNYEKAFITFAEQCDDFITQAKSGEPYDVGNLPKGSLSPLWIFVDLALGFLFAYIMASKKKSVLESVVPRVEALDYVVPGRLNLYVNTDQFENKVVTSRKIETEKKSAGSGGSSIHTSSSGRTHGGSGGKF